MVERDEGGYGGGYGYRDQSEGYKRFKYGEEFEDV